MPPEAAELHREANARALAGEDVTLHWSLGADATYGERFFRSHLAPLRDAAGTIVGVAGVWSDETAATLAQRERETLRTRLADTERIESLGKLVSGVAHELNNPLAAILNFTEDLLVDPRSGDERVALEVIQAQALRSRTIVRDLLTFVRQGERRPRKPETPGAIRTRSFAPFVQHSPRRKSCSPPTCQTGTRCCCWIAPGSSRSSRTRRQRRARGRCRRSVRLTARRADDAYEVTWRTTAWDS